MHSIQRLLFTEFQRIRIPIVPICPECIMMMSTTYQTMELQLITNFTSVCTTQRLAFSLSFARFLCCTRHTNANPACVVFIACRRVRHSLILFRLFYPANRITFYTVRGAHAAAKAKRKCLRRTHTYYNRIISASITHSTQRWKVLIPARWALARHSSS